MPKCPQHEFQGGFPNADDYDIADAFDGATDADDDADNDTITDADADIDADSDSGAADYDDANYAAADNDDADTDTADAARLDKLEVSTKTRAECATQVCSQNKHQQNQRISNISISAASAA